MTSKNLARNSTGCTFFRVTSGGYRIPSQSLYDQPAVPMRIREAGSIRAGQMLKDQMLAG
ncbi:MAG: hypothetical protein ABR861_01355 [Terriglobales bacterium]